MHRGLLAMDTTAPQLLRTSMCLPARAEYSYAAQISSREDGSPLACSLRLRGGGESSIVEESNYEPETVTIDDVMLLMFDSGELAWRKQGHGTLFLSNLKTGVPHVAFFSSSSPEIASEHSAPKVSSVSHVVHKDPRDHEASHQADEDACDGGGGGVEGSDVVKDADTAWVSHRLWEMIDYYAIAADPSSNSFAYNLPAKHTAVLCGKTPAHDALIGWRFACKSSAERFEQGILGAIGRLRLQRLTENSRRWNARLSCLRACVLGALSCSASSLPRQV